MHSSSNVKIFLILMSSCFFSLNNIIAQDRYIKSNDPINESVCPSKDGNGDYHFYYSFNWTKDSTTYDSRLHPKIEQLFLYKPGETNAFLILNNLNTDSQKQADFVMRRADFQNYELIEFSPKWEIDESLTSQTRKGNILPRKTIRLKYPNQSQPKMIVVSDEGIFYDENLQQVKIKIRANVDGVAIREIVLKEGESVETKTIATIEDRDARINSNLYSTLAFTPVNGERIEIGTTYYVHGNFTYENEVISLKYSRQINNLEKYYVQPPASIIAYGNADAESVLTTVGKAQTINIALYTKNGGKIDIPATKEGDKYKITIPGDKNTDVGSYKLEFSGKGDNGRPLRTTFCDYVKKNISRNSIQIEFKDKVYKVIVEFENKPAGDVYLNIDDFPVLMQKDATSSKNIYFQEFSFDDVTLKKVSDKIKNSNNIQGTVRLTTTVDGYKDPSSLVMTAALIDAKKFENKKEDEIKAILVQSGYSEKNAKSLAATIRSELKTAKRQDRNPDGNNIWEAVVELAPKAIPLIMMAL